MAEIREQPPDNRARAESRARAETRKQTTPDLDPAPPTSDSPFSGGRYRRYLLALALVALLVRLPGVFWGANFPGGWLTHHPDEFTHLHHAQMLIDPGYDPGYNPTPYPRGMAAHVAAPWIAARVARGRLQAPAPAELPVLVAGRLIVVVYGAATVLVLAGIAGLLGYDRRTSLLAAALLALGGLHVTQSHFYLADVPGLFWALLGLFLVGLDVKQPKPLTLGWAGFAFGMAFGIKLMFIGLPSLFLAGLLAPRRLYRLLVAGVFFAGGFAIVTMSSYTANELFRTLLRGTNDPYVFDKGMGALLYLIEWPAMVSLPVAVLGIVGTVILIRGFLESPREGRRVFVLVLALPALLQLAFLVFKLDHFPRHVLPFVPWAMLAAGIALGRIVERWPGRPGQAAVAAVLLYQAVFVWDGERVFIDDPRNDAARWLDANVDPATPIWWQWHGWVDRYRHQWLRPGSEPEVLVVQMMDANHYVSGIGWSNSFPADVNNVFGELSQERLELLQSIFRGTSEYRQVARFSEGYLMPEYRIALRLIGDRSRNYVSTILIFRRETES
jgi:hypothetical protein